MKIHRLSVITLGILIAVTVCASHANAQTIIGAEYFIDEDPGEGNALPMNAEDGFFDSKTEAAGIDVDTSTLSAGPHLLGIRFLKSDGTWGYTRKTWFSISGERTLTAAEWFIDEDPGEGNGNPIALPTDGIWDEAEEEIDVNDIDVSPLSLNSPENPEGHTIFVRFQDSDGCWGLTHQAVFQVSPELRITSARWATTPEDPTDKNNHNLYLMQAEDGAFDGPSEALIATGVDLPAGNSTLYICVQDNLGRWSTRFGYFLDDNGQWQFDPERAYPPESRIEFTYAGPGQTRMIMETGLALSQPLKSETRRR
jgi:hypothetical protein